MDDLKQRTLRELTVLARERLGAAASRLKTRDELLAALSGQPVDTVVSSPSSPPVAPPVDIVTRDFFKKRS